MPSYAAPRRDFSFLLFELFGAEALWAADPATAHVDRALAEAVIEGAARLAEDVFLPLNGRGDEEGCSIENGVVRTPSGFADAYRAFAEGGWGALGGDPAHEGQGMPKMLTVAVEEMMFAANSALYLYPALTAGASLLLAAHADEATRARWLPALYAGRFTGTMCLTEAHAGSDVGLLRTRAEPRPDGRYAITGTKIFITGGEHDLAENIVHLVLARLPDAPPGTRGISLFLVPKFLLAEDGSLGPRNAVAAGSLEHKMGIRGSATCVMNFDGAMGWLIGEPNRGLACMFTMMNYERLSIGLQGLGSADIAYQNALAYARERLQGRGPGTDGQVTDPILAHPDVRRMLLTQKAYNEGGRAFAAFVGLQLDLARSGRDEATVAEARDLVAFLTPVAKAYFTDRGFEGCVLAQQVLGGHGYVQEWGLEQYVRDSRIAQIYEGTNGIQAMDLAERKTARDGGRLAAVFAARMHRTLGEGCAEEFVASLSAAIDHFESATRSIVEQADSDPAHAGSAACDYLELTGLVAYGWLWARMATVAIRALDAGAEAQDFYSGKLATARFFHRRLLPLAATLRARIESGSDALMAFADDQF
ncbi:MAG: acyl-CoA dehydrogenase C-terminal domain-containing protein [Pseudomonadales bacterium]|jgi:alkylation response protein AidB-like acyl-CoA dehydrogenase|nr:acyl-CoA dehydrogenase C-terminal domain-containing protein [Pseudomonadales bacterium]